MVVSPVIAPLTPAVFAKGNYPQVVPFSIRETPSVIYIIEQMRDYINTQLVPFVNDAVKELSTDWDEQVLELVTAWETQTAELMTAFDEAIAKAETAEQAAEAAQAAAEAAAALAEQYASQAEAIQDQAISGIVSQNDSLTRELLDSLYATVPQFTALNNTVDQLGLQVNELDSNKADISTQTTVEEGRLSPAALNTTIDQRAKARTDVFVFNVMDFGATASTEFDNGPAFQAAIDAATGVNGAVFIPPGEYGLGTVVRLKEGVKIHGYRAIIHRLAGLGGMFINWEANDITTTAYNGYSNIGIYGLTLNCHGNDIAINMNAITFNHCRNIEVKDVTVIECRGYHSLELNAVDGATITNFASIGFVYVSGLDAKEAIQLDVALAGSGDSGVMDGTMTRNVRIRDSKFLPSDNFPSHTVGIGAHTAADNAYFENIVIENCEFVVSNRGIEAFRFRHSSISECSFENGGSAANGIRMNSCDTVSASNCYSDGAFIHAFSMTSGTAHSAYNNCNSLNPQSGFYQGSGCAFNSINGGTVFHSSSYALVLDSANDISVIGVLADGAGFSGGGLGAFRVSGTSARSAFQGNRARRHNAGTDMSAGLSVATTATDAYAIGNDFFGYATPISGVATTTVNR